MTTVTQQHQEFEEPTTRSFGSDEYNESPIAHSFVLTSSSSKKKKKKKNEKQKKIQQSKLKLLPFSTTFMKQKQMQKQKSHKTQGREEVPEATQTFRLSTSSFHYHRTSSTLEVASTPKNTSTTSSFVSPKVVRDNIIGSGCGTNTFIGPFGKKPNGHPSSYPSSKRKKESTKRLSALCLKQLQSGFGIDPVVAS